MPSAIQTHWHTLFQRLLGRVRQNKDTKVWIAGAKRCVCVSEMGEEMEDRARLDAEARFRHTVSSPPPTDCIQKEKSAQVRLIYLLFFHSAVSLRLRCWLNNSDRIAVIFHTVCLPCWHPHPRRASIVCPENTPLLIVSVPFTCAVATRKRWMMRCNELRLSKQHGL